MEGSDETLEAGEEASNDGEPSEERWEVQMKRRAFIQGALLAIPLITCKRLPAIAEEGLEPWQSRAKEALPDTAACQKVTCPDFERFRVLALPRVGVYVLHSRRMYHLRLCFFDGNPVHPTEMYNYTYENYFDDGDALETSRDGFIAAAYQHITKEL